MRRFLQKKMASVVLCLAVIGVHGTGAGENPTLQIDGLKPSYKSGVPVVFTVRLTEDASASSKVTFVGIVEERRKDGTWTTLRETLSISPDLKPLQQPYTLTKQQPCRIVWDYRGLPKIIQPSRGTTLRFKITLKGEVGAPLISEPIEIQ